MSETIENLILGGGDPGKYIAWELAGQGRHTAVVERALIVDQHRMSTLKPIAIKCVALLVNL